MSPACPVFGFLIHLRPRSDVKASEFARQLSEFLATKALVATGDIPTFLASGESMQATESDRHAVREWLAERADVVQFEVGPLSDVGSAA
ncbi:MAG TPA: 50S ribosome-binding protein YggL [Gemmatimonadaceae bacterium]|nr:50S ribosome-binding protein YggL [Gemmatimonadaceae bacterium]